jgi:aspartyl-tRNA(Asn)/glutamyl-tRNA(Gln) amidotransferase subunit A
MSDSHATNRRTPHTSDAVPPRALTGGATDAADLGVLEAAALLRSRSISAVELTESCFRRIEARNGGPPTLDGAPDQVNAWAALYPEVAHDQARRADARRAREADTTPLLCGVPIGLKALCGVRGLPLTASSRVLEGNVAATDGTAWGRLHHQGMVLLGHTHTHEFGAGGTTDQVGNPRSLELIAGGSSGGSAAALAARMVPAALGTDTGGSLRIPSACCGTCAIKPTQGRVPSDGVIPLAASLDHVGPMARSVADCAALLLALSDGGGALTPLMPPPADLGPLPVCARPGARPLHGETIALARRKPTLALADTVESALEETIQTCRRLGARVIELPAPWQLDWDDQDRILRTEVWAYHRGYIGQHERYRPATAEYIENSRGFTDAQAYLDAQARRSEGTAVWEDWFRRHRVDALLEPTLPIAPFARGHGYERGRPPGSDDPLTAFTALWNMTGMPVVTIPVSTMAGVSLVGPRGDEASIVQVAIDLQEHALGIPADGWSPGADARSAPLD